MLKFEFLKIFGGEISSLIFFPKIRQKCNLKSSKEYKFDSVWGISGTLDWWGTVPRPTHSTFIILKQIFTNSIRFRRNFVFFSLKNFSNKIFPPFDFFFNFYFSRIYPKTFEIFSRLKTFFCIFIIFVLQFCEFFWPIRELIFICKERWLYFVRGGKQKKPLFHENSWIRNDKRKQSTSEQETENVFGSKTNDICRRHTSYAHIYLKTQFYI